MPHTRTALTLCDLGGVPGGAVPIQPALTTLPHQQWGFLGVLGDADAHLM